MRPLTIFIITTSCELEIAKCDLKFKYLICRGSPIKNTYYVVSKVKLSRNEP